MNHLPRPKFLRKKSMKMSSAAVVIGTLEKVLKIIHMSRFNDFVIIQYMLYTQELPHCSNMKNTKD